MLNVTNLENRSHRPNGHVPIDYKGIEGAERAERGFFLERFACIRAETSASNPASENLRLAGATLLLQTFRRWGQPPLRLPSPLEKTSPRLDDGPYSHGDLDVLSFRTAISMPRCPNGHWPALIRTMPKGGHRDMLV